MKITPEEAERIVKSFESRGRESLEDSGLKFLAERLEELGLEDGMKAELMALGMARQNHIRAMGEIAKKLIEVEPMPVGAGVYYDGDLWENNEEKDVDKRTK